MPPVPDEAPQLIVIAGPNGSGKSTLTQFLLRQGYDFGHYINPDDIAASLNGSYADRVAQAQSIADFERERCVRDGIDFSFETVMSHPSKIEVMERARARGFDVTLFFVSIADPSINVSRVRSRVLAGGHDVPADRIVARWYRTMEALPLAVMAASRTVVFDNTDIPLGAVIASESGVRPAGDGGLMPVAEVLVTRESVELILGRTVPDWVVRYLVSPLQARLPSGTAGGRELSIRTEDG